MTEWVGLGLDIILILLVGAGIMQAGRLIRHLAGLRESRADMQRFVQEFNSTVMRAEAGIKGLRQAARDSGDDLEKLVDKAGSLRDELHFMIESADQIASRLSQGASTAMRPTSSNEKSAAANPPPAPTEMVTPFAAKNSSEPASGGSTPSRAEKELMQALEKLG